MNFKTFTDWLRKRAYGESSGTPKCECGEPIDEGIDGWQYCKMGHYDRVDPTAGYVCYPTVQEAQAAVDRLRAAGSPYVDHALNWLHSAFRVSYLPSDEALAARDEEDRRNLRVGCKCPSKCERPGHGS